VEELAELLYVSSVAIKLISSERNLISSEERKLGVNLRAPGCFIRAFDIHWLTSLKVFQNTLAGSP
jgi:hypothetical protein